MSAERSSGRARRGAREGGHRLPPALARLPSDGARMSRELIEGNQRDRVIQAALRVFGAKGLAEATVQDLIVEAGVSRETFYKLFEDKEAALLALQDEVLGWLEEETREAAAGAEDWPAGVVAVTGRVLGLLDPGLARICLVETPLGGPKARSRHEQAMGILASGLARGREERPWGAQLPASLEHLLLWGAGSLAARRIIHGPPAEARALARELPEILLIPYLGREDAGRIAAAAA